MARELHDTVTWDLFSSTLLSENISKIGKNNPQRVIENLKTIEGLKRSAISNIRLLLPDLMPEGINDETIETLLNRLMDSFKKS